MFRVVATALLLVLGLTSNSRAGDIEVVLRDGADRYQGTRDVAVSPDSGLSDKNLGAHTAIGVSEQDMATLLHFDTQNLPPGAILRSAVLELYSIEASVPDGEEDVPWEVNLSAVNYNWTEGTGKLRGTLLRDGATFRRRTADDFWPEKRVTAAGGVALADCVIRGSGRRWYRWDLQGDFFNKPVPREYAGFLLRCMPNDESGTKKIWFASSEYSDSTKRPTLRVVLTMPSEGTPEVPTPDERRASEPSITWEQFLADCGLEAQEANEAKTEKSFRVKYKGKTVSWEGVIDSVRENPLGDDFLVGIRMTPTQSIVGRSDLTLSADKRLEGKLLDMKKDQKVRFSGTLHTQGGRIMNHIIELKSIETVGSPE